MDGAMFEFESTFVRELEGLFEPWQAAAAPKPVLLAFNEDLAAALGIDAAPLQTPEGIAVLVGNATVPGSTPVAMAYAGHQFGGYSPRLGDGRALLLGEIHDIHGHRRDLHLKGSGRTPFARGGDGKAAVGPMLREYVIGEAMHALGIPTTRALAVIATGEQVVRETMLPGAVLTRVAASHLRVGMFQYAAAQKDPTLVQRLADYAIARHYPAAATDDPAGPITVARAVDAATRPTGEAITAAANPYLALLQGVADAQASLIARWMLVGFIHGVMNTDNMTISGETIDYGPCAFMDAYDPATVFSSIDHNGRYAYGNQPNIAQWNLARLAETLLPLIEPDENTAVAAATAVLHAYADRFRLCWADGMRAKLGMTDSAESDDELFDDLLSLLKTQRVDYTRSFRALSGMLRGHDAQADELFTDRAHLDAWVARWRARLTSPMDDVAAAMDKVNPIYIPRNHNVEAALAAATDGDLAPFHQLMDVLGDPYTERPGLDAYAFPAPLSGSPYQTFCGT
jgi:serine/tyrosine/threonine adenylyltransferase